MLSTKYFLAPIPAHTTTFTQQKRMQKRIVLWWENRLLPRNGMMEREVGTVTERGREREGRK